MRESNPQDVHAIAERLCRQGSVDAIRISIHAHQELVREEITYREVLEVLLRGRVIENYPGHKRSPCCLVCGRTSQERFLHVVCTTSLEVAIIITVYEPKPPKWVTPFERRNR